MSRRKPGINEALIVRYINYLKEQERELNRLADIFDLHLYR